MTEQDLRALIVEEIGNIAPEADTSRLSDDSDIREALDLDSMDVFNLVVALSKRLKMDIPDIDVPHMLTLSGGVTYLAERLKAPPA